MLAAPSATCTQHPVREAVGICVVCRNALCSDCITKFDGINHCKSCIDRIVRGQKAKAVEQKARVPGWVFAGFGVLTLAALAFLMLQVLLPTGGEGP